MNKKWNQIVKELREDHNYSQKEFSKMLGISEKTLYRYECGTHEPPISTLLKMSEIFNVSLNYLVGLDSLNINDVEDLKKELKRIEETINKMIKTL